MENLLTFRLLSLKEVSEENFQALTFLLSAKDFHFFSDAGFNPGLCWFGITLIFLLISRIVFKNLHIVEVRMRVQV